jgi:DNA-binding CsgD family transcriptional regulator
VEIVRRVLVGEPAKKISRALQLSTNTLNTHMRRLYRKLDVHNGVALATRINAAYLTWRIGPHAPKGCREDLRQPLP